MALDGFLNLWQDKHLQNMTVVQHYTTPADLKSPSKTPIDDKGNTSGEHRSDKLNNKPDDKPTEGDPDLASVVKAWPRLPDSIRSAYGRCSAFGHLEHLASIF